MISAQINLILFWKKEKKSSVSLGATWIRTLEPEDQGSIVQPIVPPTLNQITSLKSIQYLAEIQVFWHWQTL